MTRDVPRAERPAVIRLFLYCVLTGSSYTLARTAGDSLFLSRVGHDNLAEVFVASGVVTAILASLWFLVVKKSRLRTKLHISAVALGLLSIGSWLLLPHLHHSFYFLATIYVLAEVKGCINAINIASSLNEILGGHSSRSSWAMVLLGLPTASVIIGLLIGIEASFVTVSTFLVFAAVLDLLAIVPTTGLRKVEGMRHRDRLPVTEAIEGRSRRFSAVKQYVCAGRFARWLGLLIAAKVVVLTLITFEWKVAVDNFFEGDEQAMARYFGIFYAATGFVTLLIQFFLTGRILSHRGVLLPVLVMPALLLFLNVFLIVGTGVVLLMIITTLGKSIDAWRRSAHDTALQFLYTRIERKDRRNVIGMNSAVVKPLAEVAAALTLLLGSRFVHHALLLGATAVWLFAVAALISLMRSRAISRPTESGIEQFVSSLPNNG